MPLKGWERLEWALDAEVDRAVDRLVLIAYTRHENRESGLAWPGMKLLEQKTMLERKTVIAARQRLLGRGHLIAAGRMGSTGPILYRLGRPENGTASKSRKRDAESIVDVPKTATHHPENGTPTRPENGTHNPEIQPREEPGRAQKRLLPQDFAPSDRVKTWAAEKGHTAYLPQHLEVFMSRCRAKGYTYVDFDEAFMTAIRDDWGDVRKVNSAKPAAQSADRAARVKDEAVAARAQATAMPSELLEKYVPRRSEEPS